MDIKKFQKCEQYYKMKEVCRHQPIKPDRQPSHDIMCLWIKYRLQKCLASKMECLNCNRIQKKI